MMKRALATLGMAAAVLGASAPAATATGDRDVATQLGNGSVQEYGNTGPGSASAEGGTRAGEPTSGAGLGSLGRLLG
ncbi:hypothetical protein ACLGI4_08085 [Streptomyces sp. HMX112]|uniref:hypothetical protein n=1 Tax=Streptomyces sp. HMX112 TaxID=3390850 RepID=UPI003A7F8E57